MPNITTKTIQADDLICMDLAKNDFDIRIFVAYASDNPLNMFGKLYSEYASLWLHKDLAKIVLLTAQRLKRDHNIRMVLYDGLRTIEAQESMMDSKIVKENPHWLEGPDILLSSPGGGAHPRAMAIDIGLETESGEEIDMGTPFDYFAEISDAEHNPAHRSYVHLSEKHANNRHILDDAMKKSAADLNLPLILYHAEWWDFRVPEDTYEQFDPLSEDHLPPYMRLIDPTHDFDERLETNKFNQLLRDIQSFL